ncbi:unnamed protein product, partial [Choristocarpus tenellus]
MIKYIREKNLAIDLETMLPVVMPSGSEAKMKAVFPFPTKEALEKHSLGLKPTPTQMVEAMLVRQP